MGNEASLEGGGQPGEPGSAVSTAGAPGSISAPSGSGQLIKPSNGAAAGGGAGPGANINRLAGRPSQTDHTPAPKAGSQPGYGESRAGGGGSRGEPYRLATHETPHQPTSPSQSQGPGQHPARRSLQVDVGGGRTRRSPSVSPDRGSAPTSPYSVPQIAPMPSSKLCPVCNTTELTSQDQPNFNTCTQCHATVCNQCGFNPNPHLTEVQEWLCLNCQMQRALGMDMTTPRSKSQQQIHSPSHQAKPEPQLQTKPQGQPQTLPKLQPQSQPKSLPQQQPQGQSQQQSPAKHHPHSQVFPQSQSQAYPQSQPQTYPQTQPSPALHRHTRPTPAAQPGPQVGPTSQHTRPDPQAYRGPSSQSQAPGRQDHMSRTSQPGIGPIQGMAKAPSQPDLSRSSPLHQPSPQDRIRSAGSSPARQPAPPREQPQDGLTKLFGFGASLLNQASTLISVDPLQGSQPQQSPARGPPKVVFSDANSKGSKPQGSTAVPGAGPGKPGGGMFQMGPHAPPQQQPQQHKQPQLQQSRREPIHKPPEPEKPKVNCPLCKTELNIGSSQPPNYNSCTQCNTQVCNLCGFNPTPHLVEKKEWLCLNCQTQRLMSGGLEDAPPTMPQSSPKHQPMGSPRHQPPASQQQAQQPSPQKTTIQQQPALQKANIQQQPGPKQQPQKPVAQPSGPSAAVKQLVEIQQDKGPIQPGPTAVSETQRHQRTTEDKMAPKIEKDIETKPVPKKEEPEQVTVTASVKDIKRVGESRTSRHHDEANKSSTQDLSRSPQSLSDTGYSSDGISSSHSEITGLIQEEEMKLSERGLTEHSPPSPSEITKLESSMRPLLESKSISDQEPDRVRGRHSRDSRDFDDKKQRPRSLSITPEAYDSDEELEDILEEDEDQDWENQCDLRTKMVEPSEDFSSKLHRDYGEESIESGLKVGRQRKQETEMTDEEFMRRQILEMSADEDNEEDDEDYSYQKPKKSYKHSADSGKEKQRRLTHHSSSFEEESKGADDAYQGASEDGDEDLMASQGGLRRFKTIELNNTSSYSRDIELSNENDLSLDREPELEMESLTGSPDERSRGEYSSTQPPTTPSYTSGTSPTSVSSMEDDSDSSPSRRQRLEEAKQQRKARHRSHGPLLPTIEDSSEEDELREEEELLREQEKMREVEQQRIRSTARKTKRDKEELRAQRRRERSKTPPSNLSPIEDASPTEELRQAAEMEELHRSSCSEYSPSIDSEADGFEISSKLYKSGSEYNLPTFMSLYSPTEKPNTTSSSGKPLKSAEEVYEEMMRKAEMLQKQQKQQTQHMRHGQQYDDSYQQEELRNGEQRQYEEDYDYADEEEIDYENNASETDNIYEEIRQTSQSITKMHQSSTRDMEEQPDDQIEIDDSYSDKQLLDAGSAFAKLLEQNNALLTPGTSPTQLSAPNSFAPTSTEPTGVGGRGIPDVRVTQHFSKEGQKDRIRIQTSKNGVVPAIATTIAAYGVYSRDAITVSQTAVTQSMTTTQSPMYSRQTGAGSNVSSKIAEITQAYSQRDVTGRRGTESRSIQVAVSEPESESLTSRVYTYLKGSSPPLSPTTSPSQSPKRSPSRKTTIEFATQTLNTSISGVPSPSGTTSPVMAQGTQTPHRIVSPRLSRQQSSQDSPFMVITLGSEPTSPSKPVTVNSATSPLSSPTWFSRQPTFDTYSPTSSSPTSPTQDSSPKFLYKTRIVEKVSVGTSMVTTASISSHGSLSMENISLCRISNVPGTSRVEQGQMMSSSSLVDLRTAGKSAPIIMTDHGMDLTSLATEARKYSSDVEGSTSRHSTAVQPLVMNLNAQEHPRVAVTTVSITVAASMFISQPKQPVVYGDPMQNRVDLGQGVGSAVCMTQNKPPPIDPSIPKIDAKLEDLSIQQQQLQKQQQKLQEQQQLLEQQLQQHHLQQQQLQQQQAASFARYNLVNQVQPLLKKDLLVSQTSNAQAVVSAIPRVSPLPDPATQSAITPALSHEMYSASGLPLEPKSKPPVVNLSAVKPQVMLVQMDTAAHGAPVSQLVKPEEPQDAMDLTGQIKSDKQVACCDVVYRLPFGGSCVGRPFSQKPKVEEKMHAAEPLQSNRPPSAPPQLYGSRSQDPEQRLPYQEPGVASQNIMEERKPCQIPISGRLQPSMSDSNLADTGVHYYQTKNDPSLYDSGDLAIDLSTMKQAYDGSYLSMGVQYGSYTDLRSQADVMSQPLPMRRYSSMSNISTDYGYSSRDFSTFQESNLAQYSATTAREISRMCAALNSMEHFGGRYSSTPDVQYGAARGGGPAGRFNLQHGLTSMKANLMYSPDGRPLASGQPYANLVNARQATLRAMYPSAVRAADGMIYSTINTPIASTLPITTQPASVLRPMLRGVYRPYLAGNMTAVSLASLTRMPIVSPRVPLSSQGPYRYPPPNRFATASAPSSGPASSASIDTPVYLGKPAVPATMPANTQTSASPLCATTAVVPLPLPAVAPSHQQQPQTNFAGQLTQPLHPHAQSHAPLQPSIQSQIQPHVQAQVPPQTQPQSYTQIPPQAQPQMQPQPHNQVQSLVYPHMQAQAQLQMHSQGHSQMHVQPQPQIQSQIQPHTQLQPNTQTQAQPSHTLSVNTVSSSSSLEKDREEERLRRQQEQQLQLERECVELEKFRQMRLQEELERERIDLQRHREKEQMLVQREIQELQSIKQQVLQQQQTERENQLVMQREQLAQQKMQLDQIQSLQQQLQQQLEEQKRQKTAAAAAAVAGSAPGPIASNGHGITQGIAIAPQGYSVVCDQTGRVIQHDAPSEFQRAVDHSGQALQPYMEAQSSRNLPSSASDISLRNKEEHVETRFMKKRNASMPRLRDGIDSEESQPIMKRIVDSSVQTDDEDGEERFLISRRRRTRRSVDCSVQTDDEDKAEWEQPVRRRRSRFSKHVDTNIESKVDTSKVASSSIAVQTIRDGSAQTESEQLAKVSPAIHITASDPKVQIVHYISAPERTQRGESLGCQTELEAQSQGVVIPQLSVPSTISHYGTGIQIITDPRQQGLAKFERRKPDPLDISYQSHHLHNESLANFIRQTPKSPQVLYSPVSPLSPHRLMETSFSSSERLNRAHVTPQKHFTSDSLQRQQTLPRPIKNVQRSMSDPKPLSPTSEDPAKARFALYQQQVLQSQLAALQHSSLMRKVKRTLPSPPPEETNLPMMTPAFPQMYGCPTMPHKMASRQMLSTKASLLKDITHELKVVEQESTKLRKQQAELEEEEKEIDAKLRYLELGINQRKETLLKERERRELAYIRCMGDSRDYMSDSELNNLRLATAFEGGSLLTRPSTAPLSQFSTDQLSTAQYPPTTSFVSYQYPQSQPIPQVPAPSPYHQTGFQPPPYPTITQAHPQPSALQPQPPPPTYQAQATFPPQTYPPGQPPYPLDMGMQPSLPGFQPPPGPAPYPTQTLPYPTQPSFPTGPSMPFQPTAEILTVHQRPRQTSLTDLEQKMPTNYKVISTPTVVVTTTAQDNIYTTTTVANTYGQYTTSAATTYGQYSTTVASTYGQYTTSVASTYGQYKTPETTLSDRIHAADSPSSAYTSDGLYTNLEQNIPRNYVMIDDISELTKDNMGTPSDMHKIDIHGHIASGRYGSETSPARVSSYGRTEEESEEDLYDHHGRGKTTSSYHQRGSDIHGRMGSSSSSMGGGSSYYYDDYKHSTRTDKYGSSMGVQKHSSKTLGPAVVSSKRSKHRKQGMEQKISKFSPIEEAKDVESDLASYTITTSSGGSCTVVSRAKKMQDDISYGIKKNVYDQQKYYGMSSREALEEDERMYSSGRSRSTGYGMDKISSRDSGGYRSKSYERDTMDRSQRSSYSRGRPSMRSQYSEEESPLSPVGKPMGVGRGSIGPEHPDSRNQYGSSHSLPDVQDHMKDLPRSHVYKPDDSYIIDDMHCAVSDSEAYHLGQEETDWFEKPRDVRSDRSRHYGSSGHSSSQRRSHVKHTYHDYDEPPEEDLWPPEDYSHSRHSSSRDHRHHGSSGRHSSSSRHSSEDPRSSRSSRGHPKDPSMRHDTRGMSSSGKRGTSDSRSSQGYHGSDYSRDPSGHHHSSSRSQKQQSSSGHHQMSSRKQQDLQSHPSSRQQVSGQQQRSSGGSTSGRQPTSQQPEGMQQQGQLGQQPRTQQQQQQAAQTAAARQSQPAPVGAAQQQPAQAQQLQTKPGQAQIRQPQATTQPATAAKTDTALTPGMAAKPAAAQPVKTPQPPLTGIGSKAAPRPGGIGSAAVGQPGPEGESVLSKILPGGAAEQAGKLGEAVSAFGKKFTSFW